MASIEKTVKIPSLKNILKAIGCDDVAVFLF